MPKLTCNPHLAVAVAQERFFFPRGRWHRGVNTLNKLPNVAAEGIDQEIQWTFLALRRSADSGFRAL